ncbi:uncharacterized protein TNCT_152431 [Trichonephila clavata]|uniref:Uncharacterized protein n=1 Tax=Trichonephila clavata TaxID=2740835 RepID=A0A8X6LBH0_TRICU|nr:uncharacterized protein TNCT_152431 [Trichonephila clavata]
MSRPKKLLKIFNMLHYTHRWRALTMPISIVIFLELCIIVFFMTLYLNSRMNNDSHLEYKKSPYILEEFKGIFFIIQDIWSALHIFILYCLSAYLMLYCYIMCTCLELLFLELVAQFPVFLSKGDFQTVLHIYQEITEVMIPFQDFFAYPALVNVFNAMSGLFWGSYSIAFGTEEDYVTSVYLLGTLLSYFVLLLAVMLPASAVNKASKVAKNTILCLPGWFPEHYKTLKMFICKRFKHQELALTLGKIYKIDKSLIISTLGSLVSYGILVGTLGTVQDHEIHVYNCTSTCNSNSCN